MMCSTVVNFDPPTHLYTRTTEHFLLQIFKYANSMEPPDEIREGFPKILYNRKSEQQIINKHCQVLATTFIVLLVTNDCGFQQWYS